MKRFRKWFPSLARAAAPKGPASFPPGNTVRVSFLLNLIFLCACLDSPRIAECMTPDRQRAVVEFTAHHPHISLLSLKQLGIESNPCKNPRN
jgi:hypothetical protein